MQIIQTVQRYKGVSLDLLKGNLKYNDKEIELTKNEFYILKLMLYNKGRIVSRDKIMDELWQSDEFVDDNTLTVNVNRLRKKLEENGIIKLYKYPKRSRLNTNYNLVISQKNSNLEV